MTAAISEATGFLIADLARLFRQNFERMIALEGLELTAGEARTLLHASFGEGERQAMLAERMRIEPMTLTNFLDRLERRGLVVREPDPADRRAKRVRVTPAAEPLLERIRALAAAVRAQATSGLSAAEIEQLHRTLQVLRSNLAETPESRSA